MDIEPARNLRCRSINKSTISLMWDEPLNESRPFRYDVMMSRNCGPWRHVALTAITNLVFCSLISGVYSFRVVAIDHAMSADPSNTFSIDLSDDSDDMRYAGRGFV